MQKLDCASSCILISIISTHTSAMHLVLWRIDFPSCNISLVVLTLRVGYVVLTSVDRDDMPDGGSDHFARTVKTLKVGRML